MESNSRKEDEIDAKTKQKQFAFNASASWIASGGKVIIQLFTLPIMAKLIGPSEFGLYALAFPIISFSLVLADAGFGVSLARESEEKTDIWSSAFWMINVICLLIFIFNVAVVLFLNAIINRPDLATILLLLSPGILIFALSVIPTARLIKRSKLAYLSASDLFSTLSGAAFGLSLASMGAGAFSLVGQYIGALFIKSLLINLAAFEVPAWKFDISLVREHCAIGGRIVISKLLELAGKFFENLLFERYFGSSALGYFTFAQQVSRFICEAAANPLWGAFYAYAISSTDEKVVLLHARLTRLMLSFLFPVCCVLAASAPTLFGLVLGNKWLEAAPFIKYIAPFYSLAVVAELSGAVLLSRGRNQSLVWCVFSLTTLRIGAILLGSIVGIDMVLLILGLIYVLYSGLLVFSLKTTSGLNIKVMRIIVGVLPPLLSGVCGGICSAFVLHLAAPNISSLAFSIAAGISAYFMLIILTQRKIVETDILLARRLFSRASSINN